MQQVSFQACRKQIIVLWLIMTAAVFLMFLIQTITGKYTVHVKEVWHWLFQFITPAFTLILGVLISHGMDNSADRQVDSFYFRLSFGMSAFFLALLFLSAILVPIIHAQQNQDLPPAQQKDILEAFNTYDSFLLPLQGINMLCLGLFFTKDS